MSKSKLLRVEVNYSAVGELLHSADVAAAVLEEANRIAANCGSGYATDTFQASTRVISSVYTATTDAYKDNLNNNTLLKGISR